MLLIHNTVRLHPSISTNSCRCFRTRHFSSTQFLFFSHLLCRGRRQPGWAGLDGRSWGGAKRPQSVSAFSHKVRRWMGKRKTPVRNARNYHLCLSRLKNFVEILNIQVFALMQKMLLSERQRVLHFLYRL